MSLALVDSITDKRTAESTRLFQAQVLEMRTAGMSFPQIARAVGTSQMYVHKMYSRALDAIISPEVEKLRKQEGERLDAMLITVMSPIMAARNKALAGEAYEPPIDAINAALQISLRRAKIFGLDAPVKVAPTQPDGSPMDMVRNLNLSTMDTAELMQFRDLLAKANQAGPVEDGNEPDGDG